MSENVENQENSVVPAIAETAVNEVAIRTGAFGVHGSGDTSGFSGLVRKVQFPGATARPFGTWFDAAADALEHALVDKGLSASQALDYYNVHQDEFTIVVKPQHLLEVASVVRDHPELRFEMCLGLNGVHWPDDKDRELKVVVHLLSLTHNRRVRLEIAVPDANPHLPSLTSLWPNADWHERETYDFFGIIFDGHPGLTRIAMPDDWIGHPQRKDYPLGGINVEFKGATTPPPSERRNYS
jgi:NADH-quinone oxidoreductase subunit C